MCSQSNEEAKRSVERLGGLMEQMLEGNKDLSRRLRSMEARQGCEPSILGARTAHSAEDDARSITTVVRGTPAAVVEAQEGQSSSVPSADVDDVPKSNRGRFEHHFDEVLRTTRVYRKPAAWRNSIMSLINSDTVTA